MREYVCVADLSHHGIKGMRWGVRRRRDTGDESATARTPKKKFSITERQRKKIRRAHIAFSLIGAGGVHTVGALSSTAGQMLTLAGREEEGILLDKIGKGLSTAAYISIPVNAGVNIVGNKILKKHVSDPPQITKE